MEDLRYLEKLKHKQNDVLDDNQTAQVTRQKIRDDYVKLRERLETLPDKTSHPTMVPISDVGFFLGKLVHTNEIIVLLGDNWFVERSAKQATELVDRRIQKVDQQLSDLKKEFENLKSHLDFTDHFQQIKDEHGDVREIKEMLPDDYQPQSKGKSRRAHVAKHNIIPRSVNFKNEDEPRSVKFKNEDEPVENVGRNISKDSDKTINHDELLARLNELEREEQEEEEQLHAEKMQDIYQGNYQPINHQSVDSRQENTDRSTATHANHEHLIESNDRHVKFESDVNRYVELVDSDGEYCSAENVIRFQHTSHVVRERSASESDMTRKQKVNSPADIFEHFTHSYKHDTDDKPLKSILKKDSRSNSHENLKLRPILKTSPEHRPGTPEHTLDELKPILKTPPDTQGSDRRPGTPEYVLVDDRRPILKSHFEGIEYSRPKTPESGADEPRPILKTQEVHFADQASYISDLNKEETRSILKTTSDGPFRPATLDDDQKSILRSEHRKTILKSPEVARSHPEVTSTQNMNDSSVEPKPILKHHGVEAFSGIIVERNIALTRPSVEEHTSTEKKPMSKFKASRMKK